MVYFFCMVIVVRCIYWRSRVPDTNNNDGDEKKHKNNSNELTRSFPLNISNLFDNRGFGKDIGDANFDGSNSRLTAKASELVLTAQAATRPSSYRQAL